MLRKLYDDTVKTEWSLCLRTERDKKFPWLLVDLLAPYNLHKIIFFLRDPGMVHEEDLIKDFPTLFSTVTVSVQSKEMDTNDWRECPNNRPDSLVMNEVCVCVCITGVCSKCFDLLHDFYHAR